MSDVYDLMNSLEEKMEKAFQRADRSAIQRAVITGRAAAARAIQKHNTLKIGKIKQSVNVTVSSIKSGSLIKYSGEHIPLLAFGATLTSEGLRVKVNRNGNSEILKHAFIKPTKKYPIGIYERVTYRVKKRAQDMGINVEVALQRYLKGGD